VDTTENNTIVAAWMTNVSKVKINCDIRLA